MNVIGERLEILPQTLSQTERELKAQDTSAVQAAFHELSEIISDLWPWEPTAVNQRLHRLGGRRWLVSKDGEVIETRAASPYPRWKERKRTYFGKGHDSAVN